MPNYRRAYTPGACYFFTLVTAQRRPILIDHVDLLRAVVREVRTEMPFDIDAWVVMPDHLHAIWRMREGDSDYSKRWGLIKARFSSRCGLARIDARRDAGVWQPRFWEHQIRDEDDWCNHMDYAHFNPVKHGLVSRVRDWPNSSFHRLVAADVYPLAWGVAEGALNGNTFGE